MNFSRTTSYYGHGDILRSYAGLPSWFPIIDKIQHGWSNYANPADVSKAQETWCWSKRYSELIEERFAHTKTRTIGSPFLYMKEVVESPKDRDLKGTIVFPCHSTGQIKVNVDFDEYADQLVNLPEEYHPIKVCMFYVDEDLGRSEPFLKRGLRVTSNGRNLKSRKFLDNCIENLHGNKFCTSNQMTSALLYASHLGCEPFIYGPGFSIDSSRQRDMVDDDRLRYQEAFDSFQKEFESLMEFPPSGSSQKQKILSEELGFQYRLAPGELRKLLIKRALPANIIRALWMKARDKS